MDNSEIESNCDCEDCMERERENPDDFIKMLEIILKKARWLNGPMAQQRLAHAKEERRQRYLSRLRPRKDK